jgi:hypothetical protein
MALKIDIDCPDALRVARDFEQVGERCTDLKEPFREVAELLEHVHSRGFAQLRGRYVLTGATRASLTGSGAGAIRSVSRNSLMFGSSVWYSHFLTKAPKDPNLGQVDKKTPGKGRYAVLFFPRETQHEVTQMLLDYVVDPFGDEL